MASSTFFFVSSFTTSTLLITLDTVAIETPASRATSLIEAAIYYTSSNLFWIFSSNNRLYLNFTLSICYQD